MFRFRSRSLPSRQLRNIIQPTKLRQHIYSPRRTFISRWYKQNFKVFKNNPFMQKLSIYLSLSAICIIPSYLLYSLVINKKYKNIIDFWAKNKKPESQKQLPDLLSDNLNIKTVVINLEDTLMSSTYNRDTGWVFHKRPCADKLLFFLAQLGYEIVVYSTGFKSSVTGMTSSVDPRGLVSHWLFREDTTFMNNTNVKDLSYLNRDLKNVILIDRDAENFALQPENGLVVKPYKKDDKDDRELCKLIAFFTYIKKKQNGDFREVVKNFDALMKDAQNDANKRKQKRRK